MKSQEATKKQLIIGCICFGLLIIGQSTLVLYSNLLFVRILSLLTIIGSSLGIGAFLRELFILKDKKKVGKEN